MSQKPRTSKMLCDERATDRLRAVTQQMIRGMRSCPGCTRRKGASLTQRKLITAVCLAFVLSLSLLVAGGTIAEPLGAGLMQRFGVTVSGKSAAPFGSRPAANLTLPVTVNNTSSNPVPVTVQQASGTPVSTNDLNPPGSQPFQYEFDQQWGTANELLPSFNVPKGKILVIRYVSGFMYDGTSGAPLKVGLSTVAAGYNAFSNLPFTGPDSPSLEIYRIGTATWIEADPDSEVILDALRVSDTEPIPNTYIGVDVQIVVSGYLIDAAP